MLKQRNCPICKSIKPKKIIHKLNNKTPDRIQCSDCELIYFVNPLFPTPTYDQEYNSFFHRPGDIRKAGLMAAQIAELIGNYYYEPRILEIGPGNGLTAFLLREQNFDVHGVEIDIKACHTLRTYYGIQMYSGNFETCKITKSFKFIYASHVIEHSLNPIAFFKKAYSLLPLMGQFFITTPDIHYATGQHKTWKHYFTRNLFEHCSLFSSHTIKKLADITGFNIVSSQSIPKYQSMEILLKKI